MCHDSSKASQQIYRNSGLHLGQKVEALPYELKSKNIPLWKSIDINLKIQKKEKKWSQQGVITEEAFYLAISGDNNVQESICPKNPIIQKHNSELNQGWANLVQKTDQGLSHQVKNTIRKLFAYGKNNPQQKISSEQAFQDILDEHGEKSKDRLLITLSKVKAEFSTLSAKVKKGDLLLEREMLNEVQAEELVELELKEAEQSEIFIDSEDEYETIEECHDPFDPESLMGRRAKGEVVTAAQYLLDQNQIIAMGPKTKIVPGKRQGAKNNVVYIEADDNDIANDMF
jgi:hypothetical protein